MLTYNIVNNNNKGEKSTELSYREFIYNTNNHKRVNQMQQLNII